jgi:hypothetical protein
VAERFTGKPFAGSRNGVPVAGFRPKLTDLIKVLPKPITIFRDKSAVVPFSVMTLSAGLALLL